MSQAGIINTSSSPVPPTVATTYVTDVNSPAIPALNILNVLGNDTTENNNNGIRTDGSSGSNTLTVELTNRLQGNSSTAGATTTTIITFLPTVVGVYAIEYRIAAYNVTSSLGSGASLFGAIRYDGVNSTVCDLFDEITNDEGAMSAIDVTVTTSGASVLLRGTGYAGQTINWGAVGLYTFIGV